MDDGVVSGLASVRLIAACVAASLVVATPALAQRARVAPKAPVILPPPAPVVPAPPPEVKPYDAELMRLAEILGALTHLRPLCGDADADLWRKRMESLLEAEGTPMIRKERLAGAFNRGLEGYGLSYRTCTQNARIVIGRFLTEGEQIANDIATRYRAS